MKKRTLNRRDFLKVSGAGLTGAALLGSGSLAGCGGSQGGGDIVRFLTSAEETTALEKEQGNVVARFEKKYPKYDVEREALPPDDLLTVIKTRLQGDEVPDAFTYGTGPGFAGVLADAGLLSPMEKAYEQNGWDIYEWAKDQVTYDGTVYGIPIRLQELIVFYNKDLVPEVPSTVEDLRAMADEVKGRGKTPFAFGNQDQWPAGHQFSMGVSNVLGKDGLDAILYGDARWDTPEVTEVVELLFREFARSGYYPEGANALTYDDSNALFFSGDAAMLPTGTWMVSAISETVREFEVGFFPFPSISGSGVAAPAGVGDGMFVSKDAQNPEGAIKFYDFLLQGDVARSTTEKLNTIPAHPIDAEGLEVSDLFKAVLKDFEKSTEIGAFGYNVDVLTPQGFNQVMYTGFQEVLNGDKSAEDQVKEMQAAW